jgi:hypothetical protein
MLKKFLAVSCCLIFAGCETIPQQSQKTQAELERDRIAVTLKSTAARFNGCTDEVRGSEIYKRVHEEIFYETDESPNKFSMLAYKNKPTPQQIELIKEAIPIISKCRKTLLDGYSGTPFITVTLKSFNAIDTMYLRLIKGEITIGEANEERMKAVAQRNIEWSNVGSELNARLEAMHNSEVQGKRQAAAALLPYLMQQQQNQQFQQHLLYQQQLQQINNNRPILTAPTRTNCSTYGNQVNCTTR